jgi:mediator of RNA polymerase II transcription subunit 5
MADPILQDYLRHALNDGVVSTSDFVTAFLHAARSSQLQDASTLDMLCRVALDAHYSSGMPPLGSLLHPVSPQTVVLATVHDALFFLRQAYSLSSSSFHRLTTSASEFVALLLSCVTDVSQISTAQAMIYFGDANDLLHSVRLSPNVRQALETFALSLSLLIGDDAKAAREAQMIHSMQLALGRSDVLGSNLEADSITCGLLLQGLVSSDFYYACYRSKNMEDLIPRQRLWCWQWSRSCGTAYRVTEMDILGSECLLHPDPLGINDLRFPKRAKGYP